MCFLWSNRQGFNRVEAHFAPEHYFAHGLRSLLRNDPIDNVSMLRLRRQPRYRIFVVSSERRAK